MAQGWFPTARAPAQTAMAKSNRIARFRSKPRPLQSLRDRRRSYRWLMRTVRPLNLRDLPGERNCSYWREPTFAGRHPASPSVASTPPLFQLGRGCQSCLPIARQTICEVNPGQSVLNPYMVNWRYRIGLIEAANGDINLVGVWLSHKYQLSAAARTERAHSAGPPYLTRRSRSESKFACAERCPRDERCAAAPAAIRTVAMCDVVRLSGCLIAHRAAQATAADDIWVHGCEEMNAASTGCRAILRIRSFQGKFKLPD